MLPAPRSKTSSPHCSRRNYGSDRRSPPRRDPLLTRWPLVGSHRQHPWQRRKLLPMPPSLQYRDKIFCRRGDQKCPDRRKKSFRAQDPRTTRSRIRAHQKSHSASTIQPITQAGGHQGERLNNVQTACSRAPKSCPRHDHNPIYLRVCSRQ